jgi:coenzyme Q-binding protein COQ10
MQRQQKNEFESPQSSAIDYTETDYFPYSDKKVFNLIADVERYPEFLPGWLSVNILSKTEAQLLVAQKMGVPLINWEFKSNAVLDPPRQIHILAEEGPFQYLNINWNVEPVTRDMCRVNLAVEAEIYLTARSILNLIVRQSIHSLLQHFALRARQIYG